MIVRAVLINMFRLVRSPDRPLTPALSQWEREFGGAGFTRCHLSLWERSLAGGERVREPGFSQSDLFFKNHL